MFKAWNKESRLMMRLNSIDCVRGELVKKEHVLLQFTGLYDKQQDELYDMDVVLIGSERFVLRWSEENNGWCYEALKKDKPYQLLTKEAARTMIRLCSFFESSGEMT
jgi:hypothetical protein